jgi:putative redox protein
LSSDKWLAEVTWAGGYLFVGSDDEGHSLVFDSDNPNPRGISPMRALLTSLGACSGMDVVAILGKRKQKLASLKVVMRGTRPEHGYPKPWQTIDMKYLLTGDLEEKFVREAVEESMAKFCSVAATLKAGVKITYSYEIAR